MNLSKEKAKWEEKGSRWVCSCLAFFVFQGRKMLHFVPHPILFIIIITIILANWRLLETEENLESMPSLYRWETKIHKGNATFLRSHSESMKLPSPRYVPPLCVTFLSDSFPGRFLS